MVILYNSNTTVLDSRAACRSHSTGNVQLRSKTYYMIQLGVGSFTDKIDMYLKPKHIRKLDGKRFIVKKKRDI